METTVFVCSPVCYEIDYIVYMCPSHIHPNLLSSSERVTLIIVCFQQQCYMTSTSRSLTSTYEVGMNVHRIE